MSNMVVNTNVLALNSHRNMKGIGAMQAKASSRLSSGLKINSAADDAAGLAISEKMRAQIRGLDMASKNAQDAQSLIQTAEGGMQEIDNMLHRVRELTVSVSNDTNENNQIGTGDRQKVQDEIDQLVAEIDSMGDRVEFNKKKVINGDFEQTTTDPAIKANYEAAKKDLDTANTALSAGKKGTDSTIKASLATISTEVAKTAAGSITKIKTTAEANVDLQGDAGLKAAADDILTKVTKAIASIGKAQSKEDTDAISKSIKDDLAAYDLLAAAGSGAAKTAAEAVSTGLKGLVGANGDAQAIGAEIKAIGTQFKTLEDDVTAKQSAVSGAKLAYDAAPKVDGLYFQVGANSNQGLKMSIESVKSDKLGIGDGNGTSSINVLKDTGSNITETLDKLDTALSYVTTERSKLGAASNRLEYTMKSLDISSENISAAESRIRDTDMAKEMMNMTKANVLQQASVSMLAQANQAPQSILQLLG